METTLHIVTGWIESIPSEQIRAAFEGLLINSKHNIIGFREHFFSPEGYTCFWLLSESHFAIHTYPEKNKLFFELCSCSQIKLDFFNNLVNETFEVENINCMTSSV